jgi:hypothetical protein
MRVTPLPPSTQRRYLALLLIPAQPAALLTLLVLSATLALSLLTRAAGIPLILILLSWFFKYSFALLDSSMAGETLAPVLSIEMIGGAWGEWRSLLPLVIVVVAFFATGTGAFVAGEWAAAVLAIAAAACLPAVLAVQAWTGSAAQNLSPSLCRLMARSLGNDYAWMVACALGLVGISVGVPAIVTGIPSIVRIGLLLYAWLAFMAVTGGILYGKRAVLEHETALTVRLRPASAQDVEGVRERWLDSIYAAWRSKAHANAWRLVTDATLHHQEPLEELRWLYGRVARWQEPLLANRITQEMLPLLLAADRDGEALRLVKERLDIDPEFRPRTDDARRRLAALAGQWGDRRTSELLALAPPGEP